MDDDKSLDRVSTILHLLDFQRRLPKTATLSILSEKSPGEIISVGNSQSLGENEIIHSSRNEGANK